jgi:uncharacterized protein YjbI with pentapeptide repeats
MTGTEECAGAWLALASSNAQEKDIASTHPQLTWNWSTCILSRPSASGLPTALQRVQRGRTTQGRNRMSRQKTLDLLATGKTPWNRWRREHAEVQAFEPDLHGADLHGMDLHEADLTEANLQDADLREADLRETDLRHADLRGANLSDAHLLKARLHGADVRGATLCRTNLQGADLSTADLRGADLEGAILDKANFEKANVSSTDPGEADPNTLLKTKEPRAGSVALHEVKAA